MGSRPPAYIPELTGASTSGVARGEDSPGGIFHKLAGGTKVANADAFAQYQKYLNENERKSQAAQEEYNKNRKGPAPARERNMTFREFQVGLLPNNVSLQNKTLLGG